MTGKTRGYSPDKYDLTFRQKWFRGKKIHSNWDIRVEQCQFSDLAITATTEEGINVGIVTTKNGTRNVK